MLLGYLHEWHEYDNITSYDNTSKNDNVWLQVTTLFEQSPGLRQSQALERLVIAARRGP